MKTLITLLLFTGISANANDYSINGIEFNKASIYTQHREYRASKYTSSCEISIYLTKNKSIFGNSTLSYGNRKATCAALTNESLSTFIKLNSDARSLSLLLKALGNQKWRENSEDMSEGTPSNKLACRVFLDNIQDTAIENLCSSVSYSNGSFTTEN